MADNSEINSQYFGSASQAQTENRDPFLSSDANIKDSFWEYAGVSDLQSRWNKLYPYQLLLLERKEGKWFRSSGGEVFTLPIPPQSLSRSTPFAITTSATLGGIIEEHNGAPIRTISLSGTTGVAPLRGHTPPSATLTPLQGIFAGTVNSFSNVGAAAATVSNLAPNFFEGVEPANVNKDDSYQVGGDQDQGTGYAQFLLLERFLEAYVTLKKTASGRNKALAFAVWKEQAVYLVSPQVFTSNRNAQSPLEYMYDIQFKVWKRIVLSDSAAATPYDVKLPARDPNKFAQVLNTLTQARRVLEQARNTLRAIRGDIENALFTPMRQAVLFSKDITGTDMAAVDLPSDVQSDLLEPLLEKMGNGSQATGTPFQDRRSKIDAGIQAAVSELRKLSAEKNKGTLQAGRQNPKDFGGRTSNGAAPANKFFHETENHYNLFEKIQVGELSLRPATIRRIEDEKRRVRQLKREDFEKMRDRALVVLAEFSNSVGQGSTTYNTIYNIPAPTYVKVATDDDWETMNALSQTAQAFDSMAVSSTINRDQIDSISYIAGLASRSGIAFQVPRSKFLVPFLYGHTLEQLSSQYLGTPDRWMEIAALNGLQEPYVDEVGFNQLLLSNGNGTQISVADSSKYYVNQPIWLRSNNERQEERQIVRIDKLSAVLTVLTLTGDPDLSKYTTLGQSRIYAFAPNTVNSRQYIYIPSDIDTDEDFRMKSIPGVDYFDALVRVGGIDLLLDPDGDLVITSAGVTRLAVGLTNIIQRIRIAMGVRRGTLNRHPGFGLQVRPGTSTADVTAKELLQQAKSMFRDDRALTGVNYATVLKTGNALRMTISVGIAGTKQTVPITVDIRR